jgi:predicted transposase/invertase (TIGR01784 family)
VLHGKTKVNTEVQLRNQYNMDKRSLFQWSREFSGSLKKGQDYNELPNVIAINIVNFDYLETKGYHSCFHLRDKKERDIILTGALEIHFINMVRFRKEKKDLSDPLTRWLIWLDKRSSPELLNEVVKMDTDILNAEERLAFLAGDEDMIDLYDRRFIAMCDRTSEMNYARAEGEQKILDLLKSGKTPEEIIRDYSNTKEQR